MFIYIYIYMQVKSVCKERLSLVKSANLEFGPDNMPANHLSSGTTDADLATNDHTNSATRKYYEVCSVRC